MSGLQKSIDDLAHSAESIWQTYLELGPGKLTHETLFPWKQAVLHTKQQVTKTDTFGREEWITEFEAIVGDLESLFLRCVEHSEGLSFVTGEAGLIPRRDLHAKCENGIESLRRLAEEAKAN